MTGLEAEQQHVLVLVHASGRTGGASDAAARCERRAVGSGSGEVVGR